MCPGSEAGSPPGQPKHVQLAEPSALLRAPPSVSENGLSSVQRSFVSADGVGDVSVDSELTSTGEGWNVD